jgi:23S rRNA pseudouridine2604 synthase
MATSDSIRLNKYISESGICSRREADKYIELGQVFINGKKAKIGDQVFAGDRVKVNGNEIEPREEEEAIYIAFNKPVGITTTTEKNVKDNIIDFINHSERIFPIGRLDKDSQGLIFLTSNGDIVNKILRAGNHHEKEYLVTVDKPITPQFLENMAAGVPILGVITKKCKIIQESTNVFRLTLVQGLNRQIRRMCEALGYEVTRLERVRIMNVTLKGLAVGDWRELTEKELTQIFNSIEDSKSDAKPSKSKVQIPKDEFFQSFKNPDKTESLKSSKSSDEQNEEPRFVRATNKSKSDTYKNYRNPYKNKKKVKKVTTDEHSAEKKESLGDKIRRLKEEKIKSFKSPSKPKETEEKNKTRNFEKPKGRINSKSSPVKKTNTTAPKSSARPQNTKSKPRPSGKR